MRFHPNPGRKNWYDSRWLEHQHYPHHRYCQKSHYCRHHRHDLASPDPHPPHSQAFSSSWHSSLPSLSPHHRKEKALCILDLPRLSHFPAPFWIEFQENFVISDKSLNTGEKTLAVKVKAHASVFLWDGAELGRRGCCVHGGSRALAVVHRRGKTSKKEKGEINITGQLPACLFGHTPQSHFGNVAFLGNGSGEWSGRGHWTHSDPCVPDIGGAKPWGTTPPPPRPSPTSPPLSPTPTLDNLCAT